MKYKIISIILSIFIIIGGFITYKFINNTEEFYLYSEIEDLKTSENHTIVLKNKRNRILNNNDYNFVSSDEEVAIIDEDGNIYAISSGSVTITITSKNNEESIRFNLEVIEGESKYLKFIEENITLKINDNLDLVENNMSYNINKNNIDFTSDNEEIVTVDDRGIITAKKEGKTTITAKVDEITTTCEITIIKDEIKATKITLNKKNLTLDKGQTEQLKLTIEPNNTTEREILWISSDTKIVTVNNSGTIIAKKEGKATITAKVGELTTTCEITVIKRDIKATKLTLNKTAISLKIGQTEQLKLTIEPSNATEKNIIWTSSNEAIATVDDRGIITAKKEGNAKITAKVGSIITTSEVTVVKNEIKATKLTLNKTKLSLEKGQTEQLQVAIEPSNATEKNVTWTSSNETIATVNSSGIITAKKEGKATITAKIGSITTTCEVTIKDTTKPTATPIVKIITVTDNYTITSKNTGHVSEKYYSNDKEVILNISKSSISGNEDVKYYAYVVAGTQEEALKKEKTVMSVSNALNINLSDSNWKVYYIWTVDSNGNYSKYYTRIAIKYDNILLTNYDKNNCRIIHNNAVKYGENCTNEKRDGSTYTNYTEEQKALLHRYLKKVTNISDKRKATLSAVKFLTTELDTQIIYENNDTFPYKKLNITSNTTCWNCYDDSKERYRGIQCSGFVSWTLINGGVSYLEGQKGPYINATYLGGHISPYDWIRVHNKTGYDDITDDNLIVSTKNILDVNENIPWSKVKAGDLVGSVKSDLSGAHIGIIYELTDTYIYIAHSAKWSGRINATNGVQMTRYKKVDFYKNATFGSDSNTHIVLMDEVYNG